jgi:hypothetical protein
MKLSQNQKYVLYVILIALLCGVVWFTTTQKSNNESPSIVRSNSRNDSILKDSPEDESAANIEELAESRSYPEIKDLDLYTLRITDYNQGKAHHDKLYIQAETTNFEYVNIVPFTEQYFPEIFETQKQIGSKAAEIFKTSLDNQRIIISLNNGIVPTPMALFEYSIATGAISKLTITDFIASGMINSVYASIAQPSEEDVFFFVPNKKSENGLNQTIYLVDLFNDHYIVFKKLENKDSFNQGTYEKPSYNLSPQADGHTVRAAIYDRTDPKDIKVKTYLDWRP